MKLTAKELEEAGRALRNIEIRDKDIQCDLFDPNKVVPGKDLSNTKYES